MNYVLMREACTILQLYETTVRRYCKEGYLRYTKTESGRYLVDVDSFTPPPPKGKDAAKRETKRIARIKYMPPVTTNPDPIKQKYQDHLRQMRAYGHDDDDSPCRPEPQPRRLQPDAADDRMRAYAPGSESLRTTFAPEER